MSKHIGEAIARRRKLLHITQQQLSEKLDVSAQAISKWETCAASPDIYLLPKIARILNTTTDALFGYTVSAQTEYERRYACEDYYWGLEPNSMCYEALRMLPPVKPLKLLDVGCGEGKDAVFFARNGYDVSAFDISESGLAKAKNLAERCGVYVDFFRADVNDFVPEGEFDIVFSSGVLHYVHPQRRTELIESLKCATHSGGLHLMNAFVAKPYIAPPPDSERAELESGSWRSGELFTCYHDWRLKKIEEREFDCDSGNIPHKHCMNILIAQKPCIDSD